MTENSSPIIVFLDALARRVVRDSVAVFNEELIRFFV